MKKSTIKKIKINEYKFNKTFIYLKLGYKYDKYLNKN